MEKKLEALRDKSAKAEQWALAAAAAMALQEPDAIDHRINVVGAIHEVGLLKNVTKPYLTAWRDEDPQAWAVRCIERLRATDYDYWALAALLGMSAKTVFPLLKPFVLHAVRAAQSLQDAKVQIAVFAIERQEDLFTPVLELGAEIKTGELIDAARLRAVSLDSAKTVKGMVSGKGYGTMFMRATLPYGSFRSPTIDFDVPENELVHGKSVWSLKG